MMLRRWKTAGVIFTGGQGTWVIKRLHFPQPEKKTLLPSPVSPPPLYLPCQSTGPLWEVCIMCGRVKMCTHSDTEVPLQTWAGSPHTPRENTHRPVVSDVMSRSECLVDLGGFCAVTGSEGNPWGGKNNKQSPRLGVPWEGGEATAFLHQQWAVSPRQTGRLSI